MKIETKEIYKCEYCNKLYQIKSACYKHENICSKNPENDRACFTCRHLTTETETIYYDTGYGENERKVNLLYCNKKESFVYPPKVEFKKNWYETDPIENNPMPKKCEIKDNDNDPFEDFLRANIQ